MPATKSNYGKKVESLDDLHKLVQARRAVICPGNNGAIVPNTNVAAAWVFNLNGGSLYRVFKAGLYTYEKVDKFIKAVEEAVEST